MSVGYIYISDPAVVFGSDQNAPEKKADRGVRHPTLADSYVDGRVWRIDVSMNRVRLVASEKTAGKQRMAGYGRGQLELLICDDFDHSRDRGNNDIDQTCVR